VHESGEQRVRLSKLESLVLCTLRLAYHEQMQQVSDDLRCELSVGSLRERLIQSGLAAAQLSRRALEHALRRLPGIPARWPGARRGHRDLRGEPVEGLPADRIAELAERAAPIRAPWPRR
jgi:hypothetical protein